MKFCVDCYWCFEEKDIRWESEKYQCKNPKMCYIDPVTSEIAKIAGMCVVLRSSQHPHHCGLEASFFKEKNDTIKE